jgi:hypothetical protein
MTPCVEAVRAAAGDIEDQEIVEIFELLRGRAKELMARDGALGMERATLQAAEDLSKQAEHAAIIEKRNALINVRRRAELVSFIRRDFSDRPDLGVESFLVGTNLARQGSRLSVAAEQKALGDAYIGGLIHDMESSGLLPVLTRGDSDQDIADALWKLGKDLDTKGLNPQVVEIAKIIQKYQETTRLDANRAGASIGKIPGYIARQSHDADRMGAAGFDKWMADILPRLDPETFAGVGDTGKFLKGVYDGLLSGDHLKADTGAVPSGFKGPANLAKKLSQERVLHFADGVAWHEYNKLYGTGNLREAVLRGLDLSGQNTALMRKLGTNPEANLNMALDIIKEDVRKGGDPAALKNFNDARRGVLDNRYKEVSGHTRIAGSSYAARISANVRAWQSLSKLGGALLSSFTDLPVAASEFRYQGKSYLGSLGEMTAGLVKGRGSDEQRQVLSSFGVYADSMRGEIMRRFSADDSMGGKMSRGMSLFFKLNGLSWWTDANKASAGLMMAHDLAHNKAKGWGDLDPQYQRALSLYGMDAGKWDLMREMETKMADGKDYMTTDGIASITDERITQHLQDLGRPANDAAIRETREDLDRSLRAYVNDRVSYAVLEPDARTRSIINQGTRPGTIPGELIRFVTQFKSFPAAYMQKTIGRELYGRGYTPTPLGQGYRGSKDFLSALSNGNGERLAMAQLLLWTTAFGYLSMASKDVIKQRTPRSPEDPKTWIAAMVQGGGMGIFGDYLFGEASRFGNKPLESAAGPVLGTAASAIDLWSKLRSGDDAASSAFRLAQNNTPFMNLFYTRIAMDHLFFYSVQEAMNPGSLRRNEQRIQKENGQQFLVKPSQSYIDPLGITR